MLEVTQHELNTKMTDDYDYYQRLIDLQNHLFEKLDNGTITEAEIDLGCAVQKQLQIEQKNREERFLREKKERTD